MINNLSQKIRKLIAFQQAIDVSLLMSVTDTEGNIKSVNSRLCEISEYHESELIGKNHNILNSGYHSKQFFAQLWQTITSGRAWHGEIRNKTKSGSYYWVDTVIVPVFNDKNKIDEFVSIRILINDKKEAEISLKEMHYRTTGLFNAIPDMVSISTLEGKRTYVNDNFCEFFGVTKEQALQISYAFADEVGIGQRFQVVDAVGRAQRPGGFIFEPAGRAPVLGFVLHGRV